MSTENNNKPKSNLSISDLMYSAYVIRFNEVDRNGNIYTENSFNEDDFKDMKLRGHIVDYEIDKDGVKIIKKMDVDSASI